MHDGLLQKMENEIFISAASLWEIAIKTSHSKLERLLPFNSLISEQLPVITPDAAFVRYSIQLI
jgi:PIN domain nuclease of toxin-antitoxin system